MMCCFPFLSLASRPIDEVYDVLCGMGAEKHAAGSKRGLPLGVGIEGVCFRFESSELQTQDP